MAALRPFVVIRTLVTTVARLVPLTLARRHEGVRPAARHRPVTRTVACMRAADRVCTVRDSRTSVLRTVHVIADT